MRNLKISLVIVALLFCGTVYSQKNQSKTEKRNLIYTGLFNIGFGEMPLIGFVNLANTTMDNAGGLQIGFVNTSVKNYAGLQMGFVNTVAKNFWGLQMGFINTTAKNFVGGLQMGFINTTAGDFKGAAIGFVNTGAKGASGFQLGFINTARKGMKGSQIGFINYADSVSGGVPAGLLSIVRKGGYRAIEISVNELYPVNLAFKIGVPVIYSSFNVGYNPGLEEKQFAAGMALGSMIPLAKQFYLNPEIGTLNPISKNNNFIITNLVLNIGYKTNQKFQVLAGPSFDLMTYTGTKSQNSFKPFAALVNAKLNENNRFIIGLRAAVRFSF